MRRILTFLVVGLLIQSSSAFGDENRGTEGGRNGSSAGGHATMSRPAPVRVNNPVRINISRPSSGSNNRNFNTAQAAPRQQPAYSNVHWQAQTQARPQPIQRYGAHPSLSVNLNAGIGTRAAVVAHHHPYTTGYVRKKLQKIGVTSEPGYITDRAEIIDTDRTHSTIRFPEHGPDHELLNAVAVSPRHFNDDVVRNQMALVSREDMLDQVAQYNQLEINRNHFYWHTDNGFNYCHYVDDWGYHWYGWYVGSQYFWTRQYANRWWWYDSDFDRWCFWNNGFWWWQDPTHVGDLYCYNNDSYIPCNSAEDQIVVTADNNPNATVYTSPDGTRQVKVMGDSQDAFLYDTANPPSFDPVYLASKVTQVQFSNPNNGRPLEVVLTLSDGSFDMFDGQGNTYNPGTYDQDEAAQTNGDSGDGSAAPPTDDGSTNVPPSAPPGN